LHASGVGSTIKYLQREWKVVKMRHVTFRTKSGALTVLLLRSIEVTSRGGADQPLNDVGLLVVHGGRVIYDFERKRDGDPGLGFYMDDSLETKDVTGDSVPEILFHSGFEGASDSATIEHILFFENSTGSFTDVSRMEFYNSGTHGLRWLRTKGASLAVVGDRNLGAIPVENQCHYCPSPFQYEAYRWDNQKASFAPYAHLYGKQSYTESGLALKGDWELIRAGFARRN